MSGRANWRAGGREGRPGPRDEYRTPPEFYAGLDRRFGFVMDVACTQENCLAPCGMFRDLDDDGLLETWGSGPVWCNPPYSNVRPWLEKAIHEVAPACLLVPGDTSTKWWWELATQASEILFVVGRLRFLRPDGSDHRTKRGGGGLTTPSAVLVFNLNSSSPRYGYISRQGEEMR